MGLARTVKEAVYRIYFLLMVVKLKFVECLLIKKLQSLKCVNYELSIKRFVNTGGLLLLPVRMVRWSVI